MGINASPEVLGQTSEITINYVTQNGATITLDIQHSFTDSAYEEQTVAIYLAFTSDTGIEAAMFFLYSSFEVNVYWMVGDPRINPWIWNEGLEDQHYFFDDSSTVTLIFVEFSGITDLSLNLYTSAKLLPDFSYDSTYVDFPLLLTYFPVFIYSSQSTSTNIQTSTQTTTSTQTSTTPIDTETTTFTPTSTSQESTFTELTNGFSLIVLIGALLYTVLKVRKKN